MDQGCMLGVRKENNFGVERLMFENAKNCSQVDAICHEILRIIYRHPNSHQFGRFLFEILLDFLIFAA